MHSTKPGPNLRQIWQVFGPWASPHAENGQITTTTGLDNSTELRTQQIRWPVTEIWVPQVWQPPVLLTDRPPAWTVMTIPLQPGRLRGKKMPSYGYRNPIINLRQSDDCLRFIMGIPILLHPQVFHAACAEVAYHKRTLQSPPTLSWHPYKSKVGLKKPCKPCNPLWVTMKSTQRLQVNRKHACILRVSNQTKPT